MGGQGEGADLFGSRRGSHVVVAGFGSNQRTTLAVYALDGSEASLRSVIGDDSDIVSAAAFRSGEALVVRTGRGIKLFR
ncbi:MAG: hypothetical protein IT381_24915 [Deltaproteobacteria bacterium]|nr:hypothetical protein [Deltaproteobacteria bacterium]